METISMPSHIGYRYTTMITTKRIVAVMTKMLRIQRFARFSSRMPQRRILALTLAGLIIKYPVQRIQSTWIFEVSPKFHERFYTIFISTDSSILLVSKIYLKLNCSNY